MRLARYSLSLRFIRYDFIIALRAHGSSTFVHYRYNFWAVDILSPLFLAKTAVFYVITVDAAIDLTHSHKFRPKSPFDMSTYRLSLAFAVKHGLDLGGKTCFHLVDGHIFGF